ncbi:sterol desaturase family protein [Ideonella paludis]|uniref:sterol desaturase family protein n=1 Tax=Ideonella paludis TaxID=1233411 RepID=UPI003645B504
MLLNTLVVRGVFPMAAVGLAALGVDRGWGLLNNFSVPTWLAIPLAVVAMDFAIWFQHVMVYAVPALWRLHRVHHADLDIDLTTGARFHPLEILLSMTFKFATITVLGAPVLAVVIFEIVLSSCAMFNHGNIRLPAALDQALRWVVVTPDMHRVHHSIEADECNTNFGFNLASWDRLFGTYREQARAGQIAMTTGIQGHTEPREVANLPGLLLMPFRKGVRNGEINRTTTDGPISRETPPQ